MLIIKKKTFIKKACGLKSASFYVNVKKINIKGPVLSIMPHAPLLLFGLHKSEAKM